MSVRSMTGFARSEGIEAGCVWSWEIKSVNGKGLDVRCRLAPGYEAFEPTVRDRITDRFRRGNFAVSLAVQQAPGAGGYRINHEFLEALIRLVPEIQAKLPEAAPPRVDGLLAVRGVIEPADESNGTETREALGPSLGRGLDSALQALEDMRAEEGRRLAAVLADQLGAIEALREQATDLAAAQPEALKLRLKEQVEALLEAGAPLPEERLAQEAALLASKADVREELDRIAAHCVASRELLATGESIGRRLDFLCQELNREANTLCSKAPDVDLTRVGLELKAGIEQFREQVQNIE